MGKQIPQEVIDKIPELYRKHGTYKGVADELNISTQTVKKYLEIFNVIQPTEKKQRKKITPEVIEELNQRYAECKNMTKVAKDMGISSSTVKKYLNEENQKINQSIYDDRDALFFYIYRLFGEQEDQPVSAWNITQMQKFRAKGMSYKGQLLALKYFYEVKGNSTQKSNGSIGIIPYIWSDAALYYKKQAKKAEEISAAIKKQLEQDRVEIKINPNEYMNKKKQREKKEKMIDLDSVGDD